jgi:hypothetical protein
MCLGLSLDARSSESPSGIVGQPLPTIRWDDQPAAEQYDPQVFESLPPERTGIDFVQPIDIQHKLKFLYIGGYASPGVAIGDINGDGRPDVFLSGGPVSNRLYLQMSDGGPDTPLTFRDATAETGVAGGGAWGAGVAMVDVDNDNDLDIYVCNFDSPNELYINETASPDKVRLVESAHRFGLDLVDASFAPAFCDYDLDGDLDLFVVAYQYIDPAGKPATPPVIQRDGQYFVKPEFRKYYGIVLGANGKPLFTNIGRQDFLLASNASQARDGHIKFTNVTRRAGIQGLGIGNSVVWWDYNADGRPDIYIGNDFKVPDQLYRNNGDGTFTDVIRDTFPHTTWFSMGSEAGDVNNDGMIDLLVSDMAGTTHYRSKVTMGDMSVNTSFMKTSVPRQYMRNSLLINTGTPRFLEAAYMAGIANSDWTWAAKLADLDNDGRLDVFFTNGAARMFNHSDRQITDRDRIGKTEWDLWEDMEPRQEENLAFRNLGNLRFEDVSSRWGLHKRGMSYAAAYGDLDNDGDLDLIVTNLEEPVSIYRNQSRDGHRLRIRLAGTRANRYGIGATVRIKTKHGRQLRCMSPMMGFLSCNEPFIHFGLGDADRVDEMVVDWPGGTRQVFHDLPVDQLYVVSEPESPELVREPERLTEPMFVASRTFPALRHIETEFDDFARQPLLPFKHSQLGPGLAVADVDGDLDLDLYLSRAKGGRRAVYVNEGQGRMTVKSVRDAIRTETQFEDLGALFFDSDRDGDHDLYVVSGGVECEPGDAALQDRLYLNDGRGLFTKADQAALPMERDSGSVVCAADFDRDGDLDLFIGGRVVPGRYPVPPASRLLINAVEPSHPKFEDATQRVAPECSTTGLVTSALWSDADRDGWIDLLVTHEWGPVKLFRNEPDATGSGSSRRLVDRTREGGLADRLGWWNGIAGRDLDNDGDIDYVVTNIGLNTTYHASEDKPELLYYGDFEGTGRPQIVEAKFESDKCFPRRGFSCSSHAMPFLKRKLGTYHNFGLATLEEIYSGDKLNNSLRLVANTLESGVLINLGPSQEQGVVPTFRFQPLPTLAQLSPAFGVALDDFDADGWADCFLAQNFFSPQIETGRMDAGLSVLLRGRDPGNDDSVDLEAMWPRESGIVIPGDAKAASVVDFNEDGWPDLLVTVNDGPIEAFENRPRPANSRLRVKLIGPPGNLDCVGAAVYVRLADPHTKPQLAEVHAGSGYLSQSSSTLTFGRGSSEQPGTVEIRWPNGELTRHALEPGQVEMVIRQP